MRLAKALPDVQHFLFQAQTILLVGKSQELINGPMAGLCVQIITIEQLPHTPRNGG